MFGGKKRKRLESAGLDAPAVLVSLQDTGMTVNDNPRVKMTLQVSPQDGSAPFQVELKQTVSRVQVPRPGDRFAIRYDPEDHGNLALLGTLAPEATGGGPALDEASAGQIAQAVQSQGTAGVTRGSAAELLASGQRMTAVLTEFSATGQTVGDQNPSAPDPSDPVYVMKVNLQIDGAGPLEAIFMHRVPLGEETALRIGKRLDVAVNPANPTREVAIDWAGSAALA